MKLSYLTVPIIISASILYASAVYSQQANIDQLDWFTMIMWLTGGLAMFLFGMEQLIKGLLVVAGDQMKNLLAKLTTNRVMGAITGAGVTAVIQSSSITSVLTVGFVSAGLMTVGQATGILMGANLGTTITAQVIAFKVTNLALLMIAIGFGIQFFARLNKKIAVGRLIMGLGFIFFGMNIMSDGMSPLSNYQPFLDFMIEMENPLYGILVALVFTALVQSSSATIGIVIVLASNGFLTLPAGIALAMGAHIGTTVTAMIATIGKSREAKRTGYMLVLINILGVLVFIPFIPQLAMLVSGVSDPQAFSSLNSVAYLSENVPRQIANANTLFNFIVLILFLPFISVFLWIIHKIVPIIDDEKNSTEFKTEFIDNALLSTPSMAMDAVKLELKVYQQKQSLFYKRIIALVSEPNLDKLSKEDLNIRRFRSYQRKILSYLGRLGQNELTPEEQNEYIKLLNVVNSLEAILESFETNIFNVLHNMIQNSTKPSETMLQLVGQLSNEVGKSLDKALVSIYKMDNESAMSVLAIEETIDLLIQDALKHQIKKFQPTEQRLTVFRYEMQLVDGFKQLHTLAKRIARLALTETTVENKVQNSGSDKID